MRLADLTRSLFLLGLFDIVLELGFGTGHAIATLTSMVRTGTVLGIDHSAAMFGKASRHNRKAIEEGRAQLLRARFDALPWPAESIGKVLAVNVVYFFGPDGAEIREARRVLRPGGTMVIYATRQGRNGRLEFLKDSSAFRSEPPRRASCARRVRRGRNHNPADYGRFWNSGVACRREETNGGRLRRHS